MLTRLVYTSRAHSTLPLDLKDILASSRKNNPGLGLSGALCFLDGVYMQYLEGEEADLDALFARIEADPRHSDTIVLERRAIKKRAFAAWSMGLVTWNDETKAIFRSFTPGQALDLHAVDPSTAAPTFLALAASSNWMAA